MHATNVVIRFRYYGYLTLIVELFAFNSSESLAFPKTRGFLSLPLNKIMLVSTSVIPDSGQGLPLSQSASSITCVVFALYRSRLMISPQSLSDNNLE